jgi:hypothetical protein
MLCRQNFPAAPPPRVQNTSTACAFFARPEAVFVFSLTVAGLIGAFHFLIHN